MTRGERIFAALLHVYPRAFRERYGADLMAFFRQERDHRRFGSGPLRPLRFWSATLRDLARTAIAERGGFTMHPIAALRFDVRNAMRSLAGTPAVTLTALAVLTLGIGASAAIFSLVDGIAVRPLRYPSPDRLVAVNELDLASGRPLPVTYQEYSDWAQQQDAFTALAASASASMWRTMDRERPEQVRPHQVTPNLFDVLGVHAAIGRTFTPESAALNPHVVVISDGLWRRRFGADPSVIGRSVAFDVGTYEIAGIMPRGFVYPAGSALVSAIDLWVPYVPGAREVVRGNTRNFQLRVVGRLAPGVTLPQAAGRMKAINDRLKAAFPAWFDGRDILVRSLKDSIVPAAVRSWMLMLLAAVGGVLLVVCANIANLLLARVAGRGREIGVRAAMGATRARLIRGLIVESLVLSLAGTAAGLVLASWGVGTLRAAMPAALPRVADVGLDLRVIVVAGGAALLTGLLCGLLPALQLSRVDVSAALRGIRVATSGRQGARTAFLVLEVAITAVLLVGAGLFVSGFVRLVRTDMGFDARGALLVSANPKLPADRSDGKAFRAALDRASAALPGILDRLRRTPGVAAVSLVAGGAPLSGSWATQSIQTDDSLTGDDQIVVKEVSDGYLEAIGASLLRGRTIQATDVGGAQPVIVINDVAVAQFFGGRDPIGAKVTLERDVPRTVVGVVRAMRLLGPEADLKPEAYVPYAQSSRHSVSGAFVVRAAGSPGAIIPAVKDAIWSELPDASIPDPQSFEQLYAGLIAQRKLNMMLLALFGALALAIASIGIYGVFAYVVDQRTKEIGVRMALGALPRRISTMVLGRAAAAIAAGLAIGFAAATWLERTILTFVFSGRPHDPIVYGGAALLVAALGCLAAYVPARRAAHVDPLVAIRAE